MSGPRFSFTRNFLGAHFLRTSYIICNQPTGYLTDVEHFVVQWPGIRREVIERGLVAPIGETTLWRWLTEDAIRPWSHRGWIFPRDPQFESKASRVLDLYEGRCFPRETA